MAAFLKLFVNDVNQIHNWILKLNTRSGWNLSDKQLHFWIFGILAIGLFFITKFVFRYLAKWSMSLIAFIFTLTVLLSLTIIIEFEQRITRQGVMDFNDVVSGVNGFLIFFALYFVIELLVRFFRSLKRPRRR